MNPVKSALACLSRAWINHQPSAESQTACVSLQLQFNAISICQAILKNGWFSVGLWRRSNVYEGIRPDLDVNGVKLLHPKQKRQISMV